ncbi:MAG: hypothetical protein ACI93E_001366, partial [Flavobacteriales bacterium]
YTCKVLWYVYKVVVERIALIGSFAVGKGLILFLLYSPRARGARGLKSKTSVSTKVLV